MSFGAIAFPLSFAAGASITPEPAAIPVPLGQPGGNLLFLRLDKTPATYGSGLTIPGRGSNLTTTAGRNSNLTIVRP